MPLRLFPDVMCEVKRVMDGNSEVLGCGNLLQDLSVHAVECGVMLLRVRHGEDITLSYTKVHAPLMAPTGQVAEVFLELQLVLN